MTVASSTSRADYTGNGSTTAFSVPFYFLDNTHLKVLRTQISTGVVTTLALTTDYTLTGAGVPAGGTITMVVAPSTDQRISILRNVPFTQLSHYVPNDPFPAATHEQIVDQLTMLGQQLNEAIGRAMVLPANSAGGVSATLPSPQANTFVAWNGTGTALQNVDTSTLATVVAYGTANADVFTGTGAQTAFTLSANPGALANLDVSIGGVTQLPTTDYTWSGGTTLTFVSAPPNGAKILARYLQGLPQTSSTAPSTSFTQAGTGATARTVQAKLQEFVSVLDFGADPTGAADSTTAIQNAINSGARRIYIPAGRYKVTQTLNLCNLQTNGVGLHIYGDCHHFDDGTVTAASVILSNPGSTSWVAEIVGSQFITIEDVMFVSTGANSAKGGLIYARSTLNGFAQNNSLRRVIIKIASNSGTVALANNCAEQFVCDECWLQADIPYITTLANEQGWTVANATIANSTYSNTAQSFRLTTFTPLTSTAMICTGLGTANFDNCVWIPAAGNTYQYGITLRSSVQGYQDCENVRITGQIESWVNAVRLEGNTRDLTMDFSTSSVTGAHVLGVAATVHYNPNWRTNPFNTTGVNVVAATGASVTLNGGQLVIAPNLKQIDTNIKLQGTDVDGGALNMNSTSNFQVASGSSYHPRWQYSRFYGSGAWNPGSVTSGTAVATTFTVTGVAVGDKIDVVWPYASQGCIAQASVDSVNTVRITLINLTGSSVTFASGTWKVVAERPAY